MIQYCFPSVYWHFSVGHIDFGDLIDQCVVNSEWNCLIKTSRSKEIKYDWGHFIDVISPYFLKLPYRNKQVSLKFNVPWMNVYEKGCYQEAHHHIAGGNQLSYCYFAKLPEGSGKFGIWNEQFRNYCNNYFDETINIDGLVEWAFPKISAGDLLIFPSFMIHQVTYQSTAEKRVTVAGNVRANRSESSPT
jgi:uncharacterized protein (TIGR02466 family)